ncbi:helix-turn-helix transcriptional regulator [Kitasatospora sp. MAA4]|uniref:helix-turn-helix transcriptional regulator n=1 Tax=Kitasatospora sp. MAA4 TaxID=3035093 RepID=UPI0032AEEA7B
MALRHGTGAAEVREALHRLSTLSLVRPSESDGTGFHAVAPALGMELLLARQQAKVEASRVAAAQLVAEYSALGPTGRESDSEQLVSVEEIRDRLARFGETAESEVMTFAPGGAHSAADLAASREPNAALLSRGIRMRTVYLDSVRNHQPTEEHVSWLSARGGEVRTTASLPIRLIIIDRKQALLPAQVTDARKGAVLVRSEGTIAALCALFESVWAAATPFGTKPEPDPQGLTRQEAEVLRLLASGMTDEAISKKLGVSPRTARRIAADLLERLDARSRFEAGVHAVQDGWLPSTR